MDLRDKKILVTGANGFIGNYLVEELIKKEAEVFALVRKIDEIGALSRLENSSKFKMISGDLKNIEEMKKAVEGKDIIFHLGALASVTNSFDEIEEYFYVNSVGTLNVLKLAKENNVQKMILCSTAEVYGKVDDKLVDEKAPTNPCSPYAISKGIAESFTKVFGEVYNLPVIIVRLFNVFGPDQKTGLIPTIIKKGLENEEIKINNLYAKRDFTYISDAVDALIEVAELDHADNEIFNIGTGKNRTIKEVLDNVGELLGIDIYSKAIIQSKQEEKRPICDNRKIYNKTGWKIKNTFEEGLLKTIDHLKNKVNDS